MRASTLVALTAGVLFGFAGVAIAQQPKGPPQTMQGMDHSNMQGMQGMDHSKMPGMQGNRQTGQGARAPGPSKPGHPGSTPQ